MNVDDLLRRARLYLIYTDALSALPLEEALAGAARGGVDLVQIREKCGHHERVALTRRALEALAGSDVLVLVNDDPAAAVEAGAHGVHLGPDDMEPRAARRIIAPGMLLGLSTSTPDDARGAVDAGADYIGVGTVFATVTKKGKTIIGPDGAARMGASVPIPAFAIGGIDKEGAERLAASGCGRAAVCSAILSHKDVEQRAASIKNALRRASLPG